MEIDRKNGFFGIRTALAGLLGFYQTARNVYYRLWNFLSYLTITVAGNVYDKRCYLLHFISCDRLS
jgi:hypothetical protein